MRRDTILAGRIAGPGLGTALVGALGLVLVAVAVRRVIAGEAVLPWTGYAGVLLLLGAMGAGIWLWSWLRAGEFRLTAQGLEVARRFRRFRIRLDDVEGVEGDGCSVIVRGRDGSQLALTSVRPEVAAALWFVLRWRQRVPLQVLQSLPVGLVDGRTFPRWLGRPARRLIGEQTQSDWMDRGLVISCGAVRIYLPTTEREPVRAGLRPRRRVGFSPAFLPLANWAYAVGTSGLSESERADLLSKVAADHGGSVLPIGLPFGAPTRREGGWERVLVE